jgi:guanylate kinase
MAANGNLMEADEDTAGHDVYKLGHQYSMPSDIFQNISSEKHLVIAEVDIHGMRRLKVRYPASISIFVTAPPEALIERIAQRVDEDMTPASLAQRMAIAREHIAAAKEFEYVVFNNEGHLDQTVDTIEAIVLAERMRVRGGFDLSDLFADAAAARNGSSL